eukprot:4817793-Pleurochrysis_carterae.AAC.1
MHTLALRMASIAHAAVAEGVTHARPRTSDWDWERDRVWSTTAHARAASTIRIGLMCTAAFTECTPMD